MRDFIYMIYEPEQTLDSADSIVMRVMHGIMHGGW